MRAIDADALFREMEKAQWYNNADRDEIAEELVLNAPTIEPRKTGKWIIKDNPGTGWYRITCSECGEDVTSTAPCIGFYPNAKVTWDYCPNCGTRMEGNNESD